MAPSWPANPDKLFITKGHQGAQAVIDTPAGNLLHGGDDIHGHHHQAPSFSWGFAERKGVDAESGDSPGPAAYKMDDNAEAKIYTRYAKNGVGYENRPDTIHDRLQWEKEDAYRSGKYTRNPHRDVFRIHNFHWRLFTGMFLRDCLRVQVFMR